MRVLFVAAGTLFVALGMIGIFVPVLPTTPFLLMAAACYARGSDRFLEWLLTNRLFGTRLRRYRQGQGLPFREKALSILALWLTIGFSVLHVVTNRWVGLLLILIAVGVTVHLIRVKTFDPHDER